MTDPEREEGTGVDRSLVRWMLDLTPAERLDVLDQHVADVQALRELNGPRWSSERSRS